MRSRLVLLVAGAALVTVACGSGDSILTAGNDQAPTTSATPPPTTGDGSIPPATSPDGQPTTTPPATGATTTTTPVETLPDCPVDAFDAAPGPVEVTFWHALNAANEEAIDRVVAEYNASQDRVVVRALNQGSYEQSIDKYFQSSQASRPDMIMLPEYVTQRMIDSGSVIPTESCLQASGFDTSTFQPSALKAYSQAGVQWGMPFNVSNPVLYYNKAMFRAAGLDPERPPQSLDEVREYSQALVDSGAAAYGIALDTGSNSGGGWFLEQWLANAGQLYADNGNGRLAPATGVLYDGPVGVDLLTQVQQMVQDGLVYNVGDNPGGADQVFKLVDQSEPAAMTVATSAFLGTIVAVVGAGRIPGVTGDDIGVGALPGPSGTPTALVGGASVYVIGEHGDDKAAATWDFITYLVSPEVQSLFASLTGYVPVRTDALTVEPIATLYAEDPRYRVAYDQLIGSPDDPALQGPILGPQREVRVVTARAVAEIFAGADVQTALTNAATQANALIADYNARKG